jgi:hypothetical protein
MILAAGLFIIVLAGLGMTRSGQINEYDALTSNFTMLSTRLNNQQTVNMQTEINEYSQQLTDAKEQAAEAKMRLDQTIISVDVADKIFSIAENCGVFIKSINTSTIGSDTYGDIPCFTIYASVLVSGERQQIIDFMIALNENFTTGFVNAAGFAFEGEESNTLNIQMTVFSRTGSGS